MMINLSRAPGILTWLAEPGLDAQFQPSNQVLLAALLTMTVIGLTLLIIVLFNIARRDEALRESEARYRTLFEHANDTILILDLDGCLLAANQQAVKMLGYSLDELIGMSCTEFSIPDCSAWLSTLRAGESIPVVERSMQRKDGTAFEVEIGLTLVKSSEGSARYIQAIVRDITERKLAEKAEYEQRMLAEALRDSAAVLNSTLHLNEVLDHILANVGRVVPHDASDIILLDGRKVHIVRARGYQPDTPQGGAPGPLTLLSDSTLLSEIAATERSLVVPTLSTPPAWVNLPASQSIRSYVGAPIVLAGQLNGFINLYSGASGFFSADHAERLKAFAAQAAVAIENARLYEELEAYSGFLMQAIDDRTAQLRETKERVEAILNSSSDAILLLDVGGGIQTTNAAFGDLLGYMGDEAHGQSLRTLIRPEQADLLDQALKDAAADGCAQRAEVTVQRKGGSTFDADIAISPIKGDGRVQGIVCSLRDISALKEVERMKDAFVSNVSHELRTPITSLKLFLGLLDSAPPQEREELQDFLRRETDRLHRIVEDVLRLARLDQGRVALELAPVDLNALIEQYANDRTPMAAQRGQSLSVRTQPGLPPVLADEGLLSQVVNVLLSNAINYTPDGGHITLHTCVPHNGGNRVGFSVADSGPGLLPGDRDHIFERFFRGKAGRDSGMPGTGLGLAIAREIVERHGGTIEVESEPGKGCTFRVFLPAADREAH
jgi:two-component system phosphate regulon sensor histidine kinase PhoR